jgi:hypothetical protein
VPDPTASYVDRLLALAGHPGTYAGPTPDPVEDWACSGAMALTGRADGPPLVATGAAIAMRGALLALGSLTSVPLPGLELLGERAAIAGLSRQGAVSCGGASRLLPAADGTVALSLARPDDLDLVPALVEDEGADHWLAVEAWLARTPATEARDRAVLLGLPCSVVGERTAGEPWTVTGERSGATAARPLVVDLSSLWAGPLCASLLGMLGCQVVKVEDPRRPDGARRGPPAFFDLLNAGATVESIDVRGPALRWLLERADVVIEASRPRALRQLGIKAQELVSRRDVTWVSITGHGRDQDRVGFGDDAAAAGGLVVDGCFVGDAIGDPLTGVHAALAAWSGVVRGGARLIDVSLAGVSAVAASLDDGTRSWDGPVAAPHARPPRGVGP